MTQPLIEAEIGLIKPKVIVCLGATAAQALLDPKFRVSKQRGQFIESTLAPYILATVHPSSILRAPDDETRRVEKRRFIDDLKKSRSCPFKELIFANNSYYYTLNL